MSQVSSQENRVPALRILRRRWLIVVLSVVLVPAAALAYSTTEQREYSATASLLFTDFTTPDPQLQGQNPTASEDPTRAAATDLELVGLRQVANLTARKLHGKFTGAQIAGKVKASAAGQSNIVTVTASDTSPVRAATIATTFAQQFIAFRRAADRAPLIETRARVVQELAALPPSQRNGPRAAALNNQADQLAELASLQTGNVQLVQPAVVPSSPSSPKTRRNVLIGLLLGVLLAIVAALTAERLDRNLKESDDVEEVFGRPGLAVIPRLALRTPGEALELFRPESEPFRMLRSSLRYFEIGTSVRSVLITSPQPDDGKSTIARELALVTAERERVLLLEADFRRPSLSVAWGLPRSPGLAAVLTGRLSLDRAIRRLDPGLVAPRDHNGSRPSLSDTGQTNRGLHVLPAGAVPPNPGDLLASDAMRALLLQTEEMYDLVVIDTPPLPVVSDAVPLVKHVSGVLAIVRLRKTQRDASRRLMQQLQDLGATFLGVVLNDVPRYDPYYSSLDRYRQAPTSVSEQVSEPVGDSVA